MKTSPGIKDFLKDERGATAMEYGIMVAAIAALLVIVIIAIGKSTNNAFEKINNTMRLLEN